MTSLSLLWLFACGTPEPSGPAPGVDPDPVSAERLTPVEHLVRASMTLTGKRPSLEAIDRVHADPDALGELVDEYLTSDAFGVTVRDMHDEWWLLESAYGSLPLVGLLPAADPARMIRELPMQPLSIAERVVMEDRPYSEIVTADWTMANRLVSSTWQGLDEPSDTFVPSEWTDGRPEAGMLSESWVYVAYRSAPGNHNRRRANAISRALLCIDFLEGIPIPDPELNLDDPDDVTDAVRNDPACASCHDSLDPLASFLAMKPYPVLTEEVWPLAMYHPNYEGVWEEVDGLPPAYFGETGGEGIEDLAQFIIDDPRFRECAVQHFVSYLEQRPGDTVDDGRVRSLAATFEASGLSARQLVRDIVLSDTFASLTDDGPAPQVIRPEHLGPLFDDLVGFTWSHDSEVPCCGNKFGSEPYGHVPDLTRDAYVGQRLLMGGVDAPLVTAPTHSLTPSALVTLRTMARLAADHETDQWSRGEARLLTRVAPDDPTNPEAVRAQLVDLHKRLYGEVLPASHGEIDASAALFDQLLTDLDDPQQAWSMVLWAMFQDLRMVTY